MTEVCFEGVNFNYQFTEQKKYSADAVVVGIDVRCGIIWKRETAEEGRESPSIDTRPLFLKTV